ncbi:MAG: SAM-dependent chlorinase/fluorinase [Magnetospirillum sp.]|nr:SAM-dependent chlorinase/fluorinase [Magnetospirillum sp.]
MPRPVGLFTDFGLAGPYVGQMKGRLLTLAPATAVIDLMHDAPAFDPRSAAYLLAALVPEWPADMVVMAVVDPGVGGARRPLVAEIDGRWFVGPDNGLFELLWRRAIQARAWTVTWRPQRLSASFHGRDLFAPVAARLAQGETPEAIGAEAAEPLRFPQWPEDWAAIIYADAYGNAMTGLRASIVAADATVQVAGQQLHRANTFADRPKGSAFWYENSIGLVEIAVSEGRACDVLGLELGGEVGVFSG